METSLIEGPVSTFIYYTFFLFISTFMSCILLFLSLVTMEHNKQTKEEQNATIRGLIISSLVLLIIILVKISVLLYILIKTLSVSAFFTFLKFTIYVISNYWDSYESSMAFLIFSSLLSFIFFKAGKVLTNKIRAKQCQIKRK